MYLKAEHNNHKIEYPNDIKINPFGRDNRYINPCPYPYKQNKRLSQFLNNNKHLHYVILINGLNSDYIMDIDELKDLHFQISVVHFIETNNDNYRVPFIEYLDKFCEVNQVNLNQLNIVNFLKDFITTQFILALYSKLHKKTKHDFRIKPPDYSLHKLSNIIMQASF